MDSFYLEFSFAIKFSFLPSYIFEATWVWNSLVFLLLHDLLYALNWIYYSCMWYNYEVKAVFSFSYFLMYAHITINNFLFKLSCIVLFCTRFVKVETLKEQLLENNKQTYWVPDYVKVNYHYGNLITIIFFWLAEHAKYDSCCA